MILYTHTILFSSCIHLILQITGFYFKKQNLKHTDLPSFIQNNNNKVSVWKKYEQALHNLAVTVCFSVSIVWEELCAKVLDLRYNHMSWDCSPLRNPVQVFMKRFYSKQSRRLHLAQPLDETRIEEWLLSAVCTVSTSVCGVSLQTLDLKTVQSS